MQIRITSVVCEEALEICRRTSVSVEDALKPLFVERSYGASIDQFVVVIVAADSDETENAKYCSAHDRVGSYRHLITLARVKFIGFALPYDPVTVVSMTLTEFRAKFCSDLLKRLESPSLKIPKAFDYARFASDLQMPLEILKRATAISN